MDSLLDLVIWSYLDMKSKALEAINRYSLIKPNSSICVACSGGADSVALVHFLLKYKDDLSIENLALCHVNHCLRGEESDGDEDFVRAIAKECNLQLFATRVDVNTLAKTTGKSIELAARDARYNFFSEINHNHGMYIATGHSLSDCMETTIFNLTRGTGSKGLSGIPAKRDYIIRPLILATREDIIDYCTSNNLSFVTDSSNLSSDYTRNKIRMEIIPKLYEINTSAHKSFTRLYEQISLEQDYFTKVVKSTIETLISDNGYNRESFLQVDSCIRPKIISYILENKDISPSFDKIQLIMSIIEDGGTVQLNSQLYITAKGDYFRLHGLESNETAFFSTTLGEILDNGGDFTIANNKKITFKLVSCEQLENFKKNYNLGLKNLLSYDKIDRTAIIRQKIDGDRIKLHRSNGTKKLKKLFNEKSIPLEDRSKLALLTVDGDVWWVENIGYCQEAAPDKNTKIYLAIILQS